MYDSVLFHETFTGLSGVGPYPVSSPYRITFSVVLCLAESRLGVDSFVK